MADATCRSKFAAKCIVATKGNKHVRKAKDGRLYAKTPFGKSLIIAASTRSTKNEVEYLKKQKQLNK